MPQISRRQAIQGVAGASLAALASASIPGCKDRKKLAGVPDPTSLYLIFTGAWAVFFDHGQCKVVTTHFDEHTYDYGISVPPSNPPSRSELKADHVYQVTFTRPYSSGQTFANLIQPLKDSGQALILKGVYAKPNLPSKTRIVSVPMPSSISPAALLKGVTIGVDSHIRHNSVTEWPTALAFVYSGNWGSVSVIDSHGTEPPISVNQGGVAHISFRTCLTEECNRPPDPKVNCAKLAKDICHATDVFGSLMALPDFGSVHAQTVPTISFPPCGSGTSGNDDQWPVTIGCGIDRNIDPTEVGMPANGCDRYANLHNCASGTAILGS